MSATRKLNSGTWNLSPGNVEGSRLPEAAAAFVRVRLDPHIEHRHVQENP